MELAKVKTKNSKKRLGRGYGSGKGGHTSSRGMKGQKSRSKNHILFEGLKTRKSLLVRLPLLRGKGKFKASANPLIINLDELNTFKEGSKVDIDALVKSGLVEKDKAQKFGVKVLSNGKLEKKLNVLLPTSKKAADKIEKAGGSVETAIE